MFGPRGFRSRDIFEEMNRLNRQMNQLFGNAQTRSPLASDVFPPLNIYDDGESFFIRAEMPGIDPDRLEVHATTEALTIKGERPRVEPHEGASYHRRERDHGRFNRSITLPQPVNPDKIIANYKLGVLDIMLPRAEEAKPRRVQIQG